MKWILNASLGTLVVILTACGSDDGVGVDIPNVQMSCTTAQCKSASGSYFVVSYITGSGCRQDQMDYGAVAIGTTAATCSSVGCFAEVTRWNNANAQPISKIPPGTYHVCNWIDLDNNTIKIAGTDEYSEVLMTIDASSDTVNAGSSTWGITFAGR